jgi:hypothetical protein
MKVRSYASSGAARTMRSRAIASSPGDRKHKGQQRDDRPSEIPLGREQILLVHALESVESDGPVRLTRLSAPFGETPLQQLQ